MLERRRSRWAGDFAKAEPCQTPALRVLDQYPVPAIALADDGAVVFANTAFAQVFGCSRGAVTSMRREDVLAALPAEETLFAVPQLRADGSGSLLHLEGATFFAKMRRSAIVNGADSVAMATFEELLDQLSELGGPC
jgi:PAS domain-containing protein